MKKILINLVVAALLVIAVVLGAYFYLESYTRPESTVEVPDLIGYDIVEAEGILKGVKLNAVVIDSQFIQGKHGGEILQQEPMALSSVKEQRKIYLTITRYSSPMVKLPNVMQTLPAAIARLSSYGFSIGDVTTRPAECTDCVLEVLYRGETIGIGSSIPEGAKLDLIVGGGKSGVMIQIPDLSGLDTNIAKTYLASLNLQLGAAACPDCETKADSTAAVILSQTPSVDANQRIAEGSYISVVLTSDSSRVMTSKIDSLKTVLYP